MRKGVKMAGWLRIVLALAVGAHGVGHVLFLVPLWSNSDWGQSTRSWLLGDGVLAKSAGSLVWIVALLGFIAVGIGLYAGSEWWRTVAIVSALVSVLGLILFWSSPATSPALSALVFNLVVMGSLLVLHWPPQTTTAGT